MAADAVKRDEGGRDRCGCAIRFGNSKAWACAEVGGEVSMGALKISPRCCVGGLSNLYQVDAQRSSPKGQFEFVVC